MVAKCNSKQSKPTPDETIDDWGGANILGAYAKLFRTVAAAAGLRPVREEPGNPPKLHYRLADVLKLAAELKADGWTRGSDVLGRVQGDPSIMRYYDLRKHWTKRIVPHLGDVKLNAILIRDFNNFTLKSFGREFRPGMFPRDFDDSFLNGRAPRFCRYVARGACHWIANFALRLAMLAEPQKPWRILTSWQHTTVWDGACTLFDFNYQALGLSPQECFANARWEQGAPGQLVVHAQVDEKKKRKRTNAPPAGSIGYDGSGLVDETDYRQAACA